MGNRATWGLVLGGLLFIIASTYYFIVFLPKQRQTQEAQNKLEDLPYEVVYETVQPGQLQELEPAIGALLLETESAGLVINAGMIPEQLTQIQVEIQERSLEPNLVEQQFHLVQGEVDKQLPERQAEILQDVQQQEMRNLVVFVYVFTAMIFGITSGSIVERLRNKRKRQKFWSEFSRIFSDPKFISALFASPLIFGTVYTVTGSNPNPQDISIYLLAFQNGFFWESVLNISWFSSTS